MKNHRHVAGSCVIAVAIAASFTVEGPATAQTGGARRSQPTAKSSQIPRLPDGRPDLQGVWNFASATPLQRPAQFADKPVLTEAEAEAYLKNLPKDGCRLVKCDGSDRSKLESAYDEAWWDQGSQLARKRKSLIVIHLTVRSRGSHRKRKRRSRRTSRLIVPARRSTDRKAQP